MPVQPVFVLLSISSVNRNVKYQQHYFYFFIYRVHPMLFDILLALFGKKSIFSLLGHMLTSIPFLTSCASIGTKVDYQQQYFYFYHLYGASNEFWRFLASCGIKSILDVFSLLGYMLISISFLTSWASIDTKVEYQQHYFYLFRLYGVSNAFWRVEHFVVKKYFDYTFVSKMLF